MTAKTRAAINTAADNDLADNTSGLIDAEHVRGLVKDIADSALLVAHVEMHGAEVDGATDDGAAIEASLTEEGYAVLTPGTTQIASRVDMAEGQAVFGLPNVTTLRGDNALTSGAALIRAANDTWYSGLDIEIPLLDNQTRGIEVTTATDVLIDRLKADALLSGTYPVAAINGDMERLTLGVFDIKHESTGFLWKPNISAPTSNTNQGKDLIIGLGRFQGQGTRGGQHGISIDGNYQNVVIVGTQSIDQDDTVGVAGFGWALANDGASNAFARGMLLVGAGARNTTREGWHQEDATRGTQLVGVQVLDAERGARIIASSHGKTTLANYLGVFVDTVELQAWSFESDGVTTGPEQVNLAFGLFYDWGNTTASPGLRVGGAGASKINVFANHFRAGTGDAIRVTANGVDSGTGDEGGIVISQNTVENTSGFALDITSTSNQRRVLVKSDNTFSGATSGVFAATTSLTNISADQKFQSDSMTAGSTQQEVFAFKAARAGQIIHMRVIFKDANDSATTNVVQLRRRTSGGTDEQLQAFELGTNSDAAWASRNLSVTIAGGSFELGDVLYLRKTTAGDGTFEFYIQGEFFEYF